MPFHVHTSRADRLRVPRSPSPRACVALACLFTVACVSSAPEPSVLTDVEAAAFVHSGLEFQSEPETLDASEATPAHLALEDALARALRHDPGLQAELAFVRAAQAEADAARLFANPILSVAYRFSGSGGNVVVDASISQELVRFLTRAPRVAAADARILVAAQRALAASLALVGDVRERYVAVQAHGELVPLLAERARLVEQLLELARARLDAGEGVQVDVTTLAAQRVGIEIELAQRTEEQRQERLALARLVGTPSGRAEWTLDVWAALPVVALDESAWIERALRSRPDLRALEFELAALTEGVEIASGSVAEGLALGLDAEYDTELALGPAASAPLPLFDDGSARTRAARANRLAAAHQLVGARRRAVEDVRRSLAEFTAARRELARLRGELLPLQVQRRELVESIYVEGHSDLALVLLAEQDLQETQARLVEAKRAAAVALVRLEGAAGGPGTARPDLVHADGIGELER